MAKKDDFFADFDADIDLGDDIGDLDGHSDVNEDDLLMELDEMINQWDRALFRQKTDETAAYGIDASYGVCFMDGNLSSWRSFTREEILWS